MLQPNTQTRHAHMITLADYFLTKQQKLIELFPVNTTPIQAWDTTAS